MSSKYTKNDEGMFVCPNCDAVKKNQNTMYYHMKKHEGKLPFECDICKKDFVQKSSLELHKLSKHKNLKEEVHDYECVFDNCKFTSLTKANRRIHCLRKHFQTEVDSILGDNLCCTNCTVSFQSSTAFIYHALSCIRTEDVSKQNKLNAII